MKKLLALIFMGLLIMTQAVHSGPQAQAQTRNNTASQGNQTQNFFNDTQQSMDNAFNAMDSGTTPEDAYYLGRAVAAQILGTYRPYTENPELTRYLNLICQAIAINSPQPELYNGYHVIILDSPEFNAFATPGGHIFITRGLAQATTSEDMVAAVIAHEFSHILLQHGIKLIDEMSLAGEAGEMARRAAELSGNSAGAQRLMAYRNSVARIVDTMMINGYSQEYEFEADRGALSLLAASGYNPGALMEILAVLEQVQGSQRGGFNTTHPSPAQRIANIERLTSQYRVQDTRPSRVPRFRSRQQR